VKRLFLATLKILGTLIGLAALGFFGGVFWPLDIPESNKRPPRLLLTNLSVVDVESGLVKKRHSILVEGGEIIAVGSGLSAEGAQVLDTGGSYAIPGMFDMHVHSMTMAPSLTHPLFVAAGVTAVRDMGGCIGVKDPWVACAGDKRAWDKAVRDGVMVSPRYDHVTGLAIDGGAEIPDAVDRSLGAPTPEGARGRVAYAKSRGLDFLKTYTMLPRDSYFALAEAAKENGMYLAGHLPLAVSALDAIAVGQRSIEHAFLFIWDCYPGMDELRGSDDPRSVYTNELRMRMIEHHAAAFCSKIHEKMIEAGTAYVPTHTTRKLDAYALDDNFRNDSRLKYVPGPLRLLWIQDADGMAARAGAGGQESYQAFYEFGIKQTGVAHRAGVTILAGTDAPDSFAFPGSGIHDELEHFVQAGLSPLDALRTATLKPASFLGLAGKAGARADIVLLSENPLADIRAVRAINTVVLAGTVYDRASLDAMLVGVEDTADSWVMWPKFIWQLLRSPIMLKQFAD